MKTTQPVKLPTIAELYESNLEAAYKTEQLNTLLNKDPKPEWVKVHPYIKGYNYLPIDKVEYLLRMIFKRYRIEITGQGTSFNGVYVTVRVHYFNPVVQDWDYHDGIGAIQLQTAKGTSPADLANINNGALSMAYPLAKTLAIKDACDHFGNLFGANLNRKDTLTYMADKELIEMGERGYNWEDLNELFELKQDQLTTDEVFNAERIIRNKEKTSYYKLVQLLKTR